MIPATPPRPGTSVAIGVFARAPEARRAAQALKALGTLDSDISLEVPGETSTDVQSLLGALGIPDGERRFYSHEVRSGCALLVALAATQDSAAVREVILQHGGYDVQSRGGELARVEGAGTPGGTGPRPPYVSGHWEDVASRYEMLWRDPQSLLNTVERMIRLRNEHPELVFGDCTSADFADPAVFGIPRVLAGQHNHRDPQPRRSAS